MIFEEHESRQYNTRGAYHWQQISKSIHSHNSLQSARYDLVVKALGDFKGKNILDIGGGDGVLCYKLSKRGAISINVDMSELGLQLAQSEFSKRGLTALVTEASAYGLPFLTNSFYAVTCCDVIEHLESPQVLLAETKRVLKPGGTFILTTPLRITEEPYNSEHVHEFFPNELASLLSSAFKIRSITPFAPVAFLELYTLRLRWFKHRPLFHYIINFLDIHLRWNPFRFSSPFHFLSMVMVVMQK